MRHKSRGGADKQVVARLSDLGYELLKEVSRSWGLTFAGLFEVLLRQEAERRGILVGGEIVRRAPVPAPAVAPAPPVSVKPASLVSVVPASPGPCETAMFGLDDPLREEQDS